MHVYDSHIQGSQAKMWSNYTKHAKQDQISGQQTLSMIKYGQELHEVKPRYESMVVKSHDAFLGTNKGIQSKYIKHAKGHKSDQKQRQHVT